MKMRDENLGDTLRCDTSLHHPEQDAASTIEQQFLAVSFHQRSGLVAIEADQRTSSGAEKGHFDRWLACRLSMNDRAGEDDTGKKDQKASIAHSVSKGCSRHYRRIRRSST